jgi:hypothetical protein
MVSKGFRRVTPTHVRALSMRFRRLLGELGYRQLNCKGSTELAQLQLTVETLGQALRICAPELDLATLKPIRFRPPEPIALVALTRAVFAALRASAYGCGASELAGYIIERQELPNDLAHCAHLTGRIRRLLATQQEKGLVACADNLWRIA